MKIQGLAIMFIILILPISLVLGSYTQSRVQTLSLQASYDSKLNDATYDALKAYQINSLNSDTSDYTNSKFRDINASVNTFFNTMSTNFSSMGYTKETLQNYVPALVYTMYDGYYIYSPYTNTLDAKASSESDNSYTNGNKLYGLKPYIYYSCRYVRDGEFDVTITYSLDNYVQIQGKVYDTSKGWKTVSKYGYVLSKVEYINEDVVKYNGIQINREDNSLSERVLANGINGADGDSNLAYIKKDGTKYYWNGTNVFSVINGKANVQSMDKSDVIYNKSAVEYYKESIELRDFINKYLPDLSTSYIKNPEGTTNNDYFTIDKIFDFENGNGIEAEDSNFNTHRQEVIRKSIEQNLAVAIDNFNNYSGVTTDFKMPKLKESDWDKIMDNISIISFLQGVNIGGKVYNGYSIVTNTKNEDIVMEDSIYIQTSDGKIHRVTENNLDISDGAIGIYNVNLERRSAEIKNPSSSETETKYYFPVGGTLSYKSIITQNNVSGQSIRDYLADSSRADLARIYYTALGRERYGLNRQKLEI